MRTAMRVAVLMCVLTLAGASLPSAATASWWSQYNGSCWVYGQDSTHTYLAQFADNTWYHSTSPSGGFAYLGKATDSSFVADGTWHNMGSNLYYSFNPFGNNLGYWYNASLGLIQFGFDYGAGNWYAEGKTGGWVTMGNQFQNSAPAMGGYWNSVGNNWYYAYAPWNANVGYWYNYSTGLFQFAYDYGSGLWYNEGNAGGWATMKPTALSAAFMGDGTWHNMGSNWYYVYAPWGGNFGYWYNSSITDLDPVRVRLRLWSVV